jgi:hypothetical protein
MSQGSLWSGFSSVDFNRCRALGSFALIGGEGGTERRGIKNVNKYPFYGHLPCRQ